MKTITTLSLALTLLCGLCSAADKTKADALQFTVTASADGKTLILTPSTPTKLRVTSSAANSAVGLAAVTGPDFVDWALIVTIKGQPGPDPGPVPPPPPVPGQKLYACLIEETAERGKLPYDLVSAIISPKVRAYMDGKKHQYRVCDKDVKDKDGKVPKEIESFLSQAGGKKLPWLVIANEKGDVLYNDAVPKDEAALLALLEKWGGK